MKGPDPRRLPCNKGTQSQRIDLQAMAVQKRKSEPVSQIESDQWQVVVVILFIPIIWRPNCVNDNAHGKRA